MPCGNLFVGDTHKYGLGGGKFSLDGLGQPKSDVEPSALRQGKYEDPYPRLREDLYAQALRLLHCGLLALDIL